MDLLLIFAALLLVWLSAKGGSQTGSSPQQVGYGTKQSGMDDLAQAIAEFEGFFQQNSLAQRTNNPGNYDTFGSRVRSFTDVGDGWDTLYGYLRGLIQAHPDWDLYDLMHYYLTGSTTGAPGKDQDPDGYADYIAQYAGVDPTAPVSTWAG